MNSEMLQRACRFEEEHMKLISPAERPCYHLTGGVGWINDPNGFSFYKGDYHLFYQYHPYSNEWGPMHWGHVRSKDLITWERLPIIMAPDESYDNDGCFSGSALELEDGRHLLMYTGVELVRAQDGSERRFQTQCIAIGDGMNYEKYAENPVIAGKDIPDGGSKVDFRDPKIWQEDGVFYAVVVNEDAEGNGRVLLYSSEDGFHWNYCNVIDESKGKLGKMWECPDYFPLDGKQVLMVSPMGMMPEGDKFHVGHGTIYMVGSYDRPTHEFVREDVQPIDRGIDFYAPQTMLAPDGRRIMIGWMQAWTNSKFVPDGVKYFGQLTVPRELSLRNGRMIQEPVRELEKYRGESVGYENVSVSNEMSLDGISGRVLDMTVRIHPEEECRKFSMKVAKNEEYETSIIYDPEKRRLLVDRSACGYSYDIVHSRDILLEQEGKDLKLRLLMDRFSLEIFINDGIQTASFTIYTPQTADQITFSAEGRAVINIDKHELLFP